MESSDIKKYTMGKYLRNQKGLEKNLKNSQLLELSESLKFYLNYLSSKSVYISKKIGLGVFKN